MPIKLADVSDVRIADFLARVDRARTSDGDGSIDAAEAAAAARKIAKDKAWRTHATSAFGVAPRSGAELLRFVARSPRDEALARILGHDGIAGRAEMSASGKGTAVTLDAATGLRVTAGGRIAMGDKLPSDLKELSRTLYAAARETHGLRASKLNEPTRRRLFATLSDALDVGQGKPRSAERERLFAGSMTLLIGLARASEGPLRSAMLDRALQSLGNERDRELQVFYLGALYDLEKHLDPAQKVALETLWDTALPLAPPVDLYTKHRKEPLQVRHTIHEEFWHEELAFYKAPEFKLVSKNEKDTERVYEGTRVDPTGKNPPLEVRVEVRKDELDVLQAMGDPNAHVIIYSGHSSLGGNGSQSIADAEPMRGLPKTVLMANCRGKDNYAEFVNKFPDGMLITTEHPTYSAGGQLRVAALYDTLARGESFAYMRSQSETQVWDEPANNYFYPDEERRFRFLDADEDGHADANAVRRDPLFDVHRRKRNSDFTRAIAFVNSVLFYHWEVDLELGHRSHYGRAYGDHVIAAGVLEDARPGELVRVTPSRARGASGEVEQFYEVRFDPQDLGPNRDLYAGLVTAEIVMALAKERDGAVSKFEAMRAIVLGAQAVHYLDVYADTGPETMRAYFRTLGLGEVNPDDIERLFKKYDAHANDPQVQAFIELFENKYHHPLTGLVPRHLEP